MNASRRTQPRSGVIGNIAEIMGRIKAHNVTVTSAGIAFYGLLALVPTLIALVSVYALIADPEDIQTQVSDIAGSLDTTTQDFLTGQLESIVGEVNENGESSGSATGRITALVLGLGLALFSASGAVQKLINTVSVAYEARETRPGWKLRAMAYVFTFGAIVGVALMVFTIGVVPAILDELDLGGAATSAISILQLPVLAILFAGALTVLYRYGPDRQPRTPWRNPGALVATLLFLLFAIAFSFYSSNVGLMPASYGLLGSIAALMIFLQLTALAVIIGAEVNGAIEVRSLASTPELQPTGAALVPYAGGAGERADEDAEPRKILSFGTALAGLAALFALGRAATKD